MSKLPEFTEVAVDLWSVPVSGGTIYRYGRGSGSHIVFAPWPQQQAMQYQVYPTTMTPMPYQPIPPMPQQPTFYAGKLQ